MIDFPVQYPLGLSDCNEYKTAEMTQMFGEFKPIMYVEKSVRKCSFAYFISLPPPRLEKQNKLTSISCK